MLVLEFDSDLFRGAPRRGPPRAPGAPGGPPGPPGPPRGPPQETPLGPPWRPPCSPLLVLSLRGVPGPPVPQGHLACAERLAEPGQESKRGVSGDPTRRGIISCRGWRGPGAIRPLSGWGSGATDRARSGDEAHPRQNPRPSQHSEPTARRQGSQRTTVSEDTRRRLSGRRVLRAKVRKGADLGGPGSDRRRGPPGTPEVGPRPPRDILFSSGPAPLLSNPLPRHCRHQPPTPTPPSPAAPPPPLGPRAPLGRVRAAHGVGAAGDSRQLLIAQ